jgi:hypothetical protein
MLDEIIKATYLRFGTRTFTMGEFTRLMQVTINRRPLPDDWRSWANHANGVGWLEDLGQDGDGHYISRLNSHALAVATA